MDWTYEIMQRSERHQIELYSLCECAIMLHK